MNQDILARKYNLDLSQPNPIIVSAGGREELIELWRELGYKVGAEVGVQRADFAERICKGIPGLKYYGIDSWTPYAGYLDIVASRHGQGSFDRLYETAKTRLAPFDATLIKKWSVEAAKDFADGSLDFVYIDGNHNFQQTTADISAWLPKIRVEGMICGHDYARVNRTTLTIHCKDVVDGWTNAHNDKLFVYYKERSPNWLFFKR
jgi:Methyltransferase domain